MSFSHVFMGKIISFFYSNLGVALFGGSDLVGELFEKDFEILIVFNDLFDLFHGMGDGRVVFHPKIERDLGHGIGCEIPGEVDNDPAGIDDTFGSFLRADIGGFDVELFGDDLDDVIDGDVLLLLFDLVFDGVFGKIEGDLLPEHVAHGIEFDDGAFDLTDVVSHVGGDVMDDIAIKLDTIEFTFFVYDGDFGLETGGLNIGHQSPLKTAAQPIDQTGDLVGVPVGGDDDLFFGLMQFIKGMKKLLLGLFLAAEKLYIVDQKDIAFTKMIPKAIHGLGAQVGSEFIHELFKRCVDDVFSL